MNEKFGSRTERLNVFQSAASHRGLSICHHLIATRQQGFVARSDPIQPAPPVTKGLHQNIEYTAKEEFSGLGGSALIALWLIYGVPAGCLL